MPQSPSEKLRDIRQRRHELRDQWEDLTNLRRAELTRDIRKSYAAKRAEIKAKITERETAELRAIERQLETEFADQYNSIFGELADLQREANTAYVTRYRLRQRGEE